MDFLTRRRDRNRPRQPSLSNSDSLGVPYSQAQSRGSPIPVNTLGQSIRQSGGVNNISAPITNPTLTANGTELNMFTRQRGSASGSDERTGSEKMEMPTPE